jgi:hypothetical protein
MSGITASAAGRGARQPFSGGFDRTSIAATRTARNEYSQPTYTEGGNTGTGHYTVDGGITWAVWTTPVSCGRALTFVCDNTLFVIDSARSSGVAPLRATNLVQMTSDGVNWTSATLPVAIWAAGGGLPDVRAIPLRAFRVGSTYHFFTEYLTNVPNSRVRHFSTTDFISWSAVTEVIGFGTSFFDIALAGSTFVYAVGEIGFPVKRPLRTAPVSTPAVLDDPMLDATIVVQGPNNTVLALNLDTETSYSTTDGVSFSNFSTNFQEIYAVAYNPQRKVYVASVRQGGVDRILASANGVDWSLVATEGPRFSLTPSQFAVLNVNWPGSGNTLVRAYF